MFAVIVALLFLIQPIQPARSVADCLVQSGYSQVIETNEVTTLRGMDATEWGDVLARGRLIGLMQVETDTARRMVLFYAWSERVYAFVAKHPDDPNRRLPGEDASVWHGDCMLRLGDG